MCNKLTYEAASNLFFSLWGERRKLEEPTDAYLHHGNAYPDYEKMLHIKFRFELWRMIILVTDQDLKFVPGYDFCHTKM